MNEEGEGELRRRKRGRREGIDERNRREKSIV
jgi:hypothetical protein